MKQYSNQEVNEELVKGLDALRQVPERDPAVVARNRARYLSTARRLKNTSNVPLPVTEKPVWRLNRWIGTKLNPLRKEHKPMFSMLISLVVAFAIAFGGAGATAYAVQASTPDQPLYAVKLAIEDAQLALATSEQTKFEYAMAFTNKRVDEITAMQAKGEPVTEPVMTRLLAQYMFAFKFASDLPEEETEEALTQMRETIRKQDRIMNMTRTNAPEDLDPAMEMIQQIIRHQLAFAEEALEDPLAFRLRFRPDLENGNPSGPPEEIPGTGQGPFNGPSEETGDPGQGPANGSGNENPGSGGQGSGSGSGGSGSQVAPADQPTPNPTPGVSQTYGSAGSSGSGAKKQNKSGGGGKP